MRRISILAMVVPVAITLAVSLAGVAALWTIRDDLPTPLATHWGASGQADGFATLGQVIAGAIALPQALTLFMAGLGAVMRQRAVMSGIATGMGVFIAGLSILTAYTQRGLADGRSAELSNLVFIAPAALGLILGIGVGLLFRHRPEPGVTAGPIPADAPRHTGTTWTGPLRRGRTGITIMIAASLITFGIGVAMWVATGVWFGLLLALILLALVPMFYADVTINDDGVRVSSLGLKLRHVPLDRVASARVTQVSCLGDYGGFGMRAGFDGSWGFVTSDGEALRVEVAGGSDLVLTVDDAERAAGVLNSLADRHR